MSEYVVTAEVNYIGFRAQYTRLVDAIVCVKKLLLAGAKDIRLNGNKLEEE